MSFDLAVWVGSVAAASLRWAELEDDEDGLELEALPRERLVEALMAELGDVLVEPAGAGASGVGVSGKGWECWIDGGVTTIVCDWSWTEEPTRITPLIRAAHRAGCSVYDPQHGAHWPAANGTPEPNSDAWSVAVFDEGFVFEDEDDEGSVPEQAMRLCPDDAWPLNSEVWIDTWVVEPSTFLANFVSQRARLYRTRFPGWKIHAGFGGPGAADLKRPEVQGWLKRTKAKAGLNGRESPTAIVFVVLGNFRADILVGELTPCPFELVPVSPEYKLMAVVLSELVASLIVSVPTRIVAQAPDTIRAGLRALLDAIVRLRGGSPLHLMDLTRPNAATVGTNLGWLEVLVGLAPSEPVGEASVSEVVVERADEEEDEEEDE